MAATLGAHGSYELTLDVPDAGSRNAPVLIKIDVAPPGTPPPPGAGPWARPPVLLLRRTEEFDLSRVPLTADLSQLGNPRGPVEKAVYAVAFLLLGVGLALSRAGSPAAGSVVGTVGVVMTIVLFLRKFLFRRDR